MCEQTGPPTVAEKAASRYEAARAAREGMQIDLIALASRAIHGLYNNEKSYSHLTLGSFIKGESGDMEVLSVHVNTWFIPHTRYFLPDWQRGASDRDFFAFPLDQTIIEQTADGAKAILFDRFIQRCNLREYIALCRGLEKLGDPIPVPPPTYKGGDGMDND